MRSLRRAAAVAVGALLLQAPAGAAFAAGTGREADSPAGVTPAAVNTAVAVNSTAHDSVFNLSFRISRATGSSVVATDLALAVASCSDCRTAAIAVQVVLVSPIPQVLTATDSSLAVNSSCVACDTFAAAFQYVIASDTRLRLTRWGRMSVTRIEHRLAALRDQALSPSELSTAVSALATELAYILDTELVGTPSR